MLLYEPQVFNRSVNSIATRTGDDGTTSLLFGCRVPKTDARIVANGRVDELNARLGMAKACLPPDESESRAFIEQVQRNLVNLMGEVAVAPEDWERYAASGMPNFDEALLGVLDGRVARLESEGFTYKGWATPGANLSAAALDCARTACREAEIALLSVNQAGLLNPQRADTILQSLNRLSDVLWLEARRAESAIFSPRE
ncbi:MAG: ATP:cob(I)alamin adenosyltransferase [Chthoniobacterales bacterium]|nr:ATP:cob(I)alamin adenosyltransferase [Chthoniobacterales bacterium]